MTMATILPYNHSMLNASFESFENLRADPLCSSISPPQHQSKLIPAIYGVIFVLGFIGNGLVVLVLSHRSSQKTMANTYLLNLALSDLLFSTSLPFWAVYYFYDYDWVFGKLMCKVCGWLLSINVYGSIFFITCMSVDRCRAIVHPLQSQSQRNLCQARAVSCVVWVAAILPTIPALVFRDVHYLEELKVTACVIHFPSTGWFIGLALMKIILGFLVPFAIIATCYCTIGRNLLGSAPLEEGSDHLERALRMVVAVVLAFFICWFPFHLFTFLNTLSALKVLTACWVRWAVEAVIPFALCLSFYNSAINPFLYCFVGNHFREQLASLVQAWVPRLCQKTGSLSSRLSSFSRKLSDQKELGSQDTSGEHKRGSRSRGGIRSDLMQDSSVSSV